MPFTSSPVSKDNVSINISITSNIVPGGIEKFSHHLVDKFPNIIPINITREERSSRKSKGIIESYINNNSVDIILLNEPWLYRSVHHLNIPIIVIIHEPLVRDVRFLGFGDIMRNMIDDGVHIYFVSKKQFLFHKDLVKRISDVDISESDIKGYINPSFCVDMPFSDNYLYDCSTVGRNSSDKNPFILHNLLKESELISLVMTNDGIHKSDNQNKYVTKNSNWTYPQETLRLLPHTEVLENISKSKCFLSTWAMESWGITTMESLGCGVPTIILTDDSNTHASEDIAADKSHYIKLNKKVKKEEFVNVVKKLSDTPISKRREIHEMTLEKHSKDNWIGQFEKMFNYRNEDVKNINISLENLFNG